MLLLLASSCGDEAPETAPASPSPTAAVPGPTTTTPSPLTEGCTPEPATSLSASWAAHESLSGSFTFSYPGDWDDVSGDIGARADEFLAETTLAELGLSGDESVPADVVQDPVSGDNLGAFRFGDVDSPLEVIAQRQLELFGALPAISVTNPSVELCADGELGLGLELTAAVAGEGQRYQKLVYTVRDGTLYLIYIDGADAGAADVLDEAIRTWAWS